jgi:hypothetical protein
MIRHYHVRTALFAILITLIALDSNTRAHSLRGQLNIRQVDGNSNGMLGKEIEEK